LFYGKISQKKIAGKIKYLYFSLNKIQDTLPKKEAASNLLNTFLSYFIKSNIHPSFFITILGGFK
jgi:hypothetical protein